ncbi:MAG: DUF6412 domain-containing protein [Spirillospora sp.]
MIWSLLAFAVLRGFTVAEWAASGTGQPMLLALATVTVTGLLALAAVHIRTSRQGHRTSRALLRTTLRERTLRTAFLPQRDPDAAGRPRPRAPGVESAAA